MHRLRSRANWKAPVVGGVLFAAGLLQARNLVSGRPGSARQAARSTAPTRIGIGTLLVIKPELMARLLHGKVSVDPATRLHLRMLAVREVALGLGTVLALGTEQDVRRWLLVLALVDTGEALALVPTIRRGTVSPAVGFAFVAADLGNSATGMGVLTQLVRDRRRTESRSAVAVPGDGEG